MTPDVSGLDGRVRGVLARCRVEGGMLFLPGGLGTDDHLRVNKALVGLGGTWVWRARGYAFPFDPAVLVAQGGAAGGEDRDG